MKKAFVISLLFLNLAGYSQKSKIEIGFQGGVNLNTAYGSNIPKNTLGNTTGLSIGGTAKWKLTDRFGFITQPSYEQLGWTYPLLMFESDFYTNTKTASLNKLDYLHLPVLAEYSIGKKVKWIVTAGIFAGVLLKGKRIEKKISINSGAETATNTSSIKDLNRLNFGLSVGTGLKVPLSNKIAFTANVRNIIGLTKTGKYNPIKLLTYSFLSGLSFQL